MSTPFDQNDINDDLLFVLNKFEESKLSDSIVAPEKLSAKNLFEKYESELDESTNPSQPININHKRFFRQIGSIAAAVMVLIVGIFAYNSLIGKNLTGYNDAAVQEEFRMDEATAELEDSAETYQIDSDQTLPTTRSGIIPTSSLGDLGYNIDKTILPSSDDANMDWEELDYHNNKVNTLVVTVNEKTIILGYLMSFTESVSPDSIVSVGEYEERFYDLSPTPLPNNDGINIYFAENIGSDSLDSRIYSAGYNSEEIDIIKNIMNEVKNKNADYIVSL